MAPQVSKRRLVVCASISCALIALGSAVAWGQDSLGSLEIGTCFPPPEPYPYKLEKNDPLYEAAREEHQAHLEGMEDYVNCLDRERSAALVQLRTSFDLFLANFGKDAVLSYGEERKARQ